MDPLASQEPQDEYRLATPSEIEQAKANAANEVKDACEGRNLNEVLGIARQYVHSYRDILDEGFRRQGWFSDLPERIDESFPSADPETRRQVTKEVMSLIRTRLGNPKSPHTHQEFVTATERRLNVYNELANRLSEEDLVELERQARKLVPKFPDNYGDFRAYWLAEWLAKGFLFLPDGPSAASLFKKTE